MLGSFKHWCQACLSITAWIVHLAVICAANGGCDLGQRLFQNINGLRFPDNQNQRGYGAFGARFLICLDCIPLLIIVLIQSKRWWMWWTSTCQQVPLQQINFKGRVWALVSRITTQQYLLLFWHRICYFSQKPFAYHQSNSSSSRGVVSRGGSAGKGPPPPVQTPHPTLKAPIGPEDDGNTALAIP